MKNSSPACNKRNTACLVLALLLTGCAGVANRTVGTEANAEPNQLPRNYMQGLSHMANGDFDSAIPILQRFSTAHPELAGPWLNLGIALRHSGRTEEATEALEKAIELNPDNAAAWQQLAILHREQGRFDAALEAYRKALQLVPDYALVHRNLGILYDLYLQQPALALDHYRKYQALSDEPDAEVNRWIIDLERRTGDTQARNSQ